MSVTFTLKKDHKDPQQEHASLSIRISYVTCHWCICKLSLSNVLDLNVTDVLFIFKLWTYFRCVFSACINSFLIKAYQRLSFVFISSALAVLLKQFCIFLDLKTLCEMKLKCNWVYWVKTVLMSSLIKWQHNRWNLSGDGLLLRLQSFIC